MKNWFTNLFINKKKETDDESPIFNSLPIDELDNDTGDESGAGETRFIRIVPVGYFPNHAIPHDITREHIEQMAVNARDAGTDILFDYEHKSLWGDTKAAGWGERSTIEAREDGLYIQYPTFTPAAANAIKDKEYRYLSPVYKFGQRDKQGREIGAVLHSVALTNKPYMDREIDHIGNSQHSDQRIDMKLSKDSLAKLGLPEDATEQQVNEAIANFDAGDGSPAAGAQQSGCDNAGGNNGQPVANSALEQKIANLEKKLADRDERDTQQRDETLVNSWISQGKVAPADKDLILNSLKADFDGTKSKIEQRKPNWAMPKGVHVNSEASGSDDNKMSFADYAKARLG